MIGQKRCLLSLVVVAIVALHAAHAVKETGVPIKYPKSNKRPLPEFVVSPSAEYYMIKAKALTLTCRARHAYSIQVVCGGEELANATSRLVAEASTARVRTTKAADDDERDLESLDLDHRAAVPESEVQWNVSFADVEEYAEDTDFSCECLAWPEKQRSSMLLPVRTNQTRILVATLKKMFAQEPIHQTVAANTQVQLQCMAPEGKPTPEIFWLKDGLPVNPEEDSNVFINSYGSLMINQARETDTGSYVCVAQNLVGRRQTESANLTVYVDGRWSDWTPWNPPTCAAAKCGGQLVVQTRHRQCIEPKNGGRQCNGSTTERRPCTANCGYDGSWSEWSDWGPSKCDKHCKQYRQRVCEATSDRDRGVQACDGPSKQERQCANCVVTEVASASGLPVDVQTLLIYVAAASGIAIFFAAAMAVYFRRKRRLPTSDSFTLYVENGDEKAASCVSCRKTTRAKDRSADLKTQSMRLIHSNEDVVRSPGTLNLSVTPSRSDLTPLGSSTVQQPEGSRSTIYLTSLTPCRPSTIASTQMPLTGRLGASQPLCAPYTVETQLGMTPTSEVKVHGTFGSSHVYQPTLSSATLSLPPPPPQASHATDSPQQARVAQVAPLRCAAAPLTTNMVNYHDRIMMNSFALRPAACECSVTCTSAQEPTSCDEDGASVSATPYCATSQCESACVCENDYALYPDSSDHQYATFSEVTKNVTNTAASRFAEHTHHAHAHAHACCRQQNRSAACAYAPRKRASLSGAEGAKARPQISVCVPDGTLLPACASIGVASIHDEAERPRLRGERQTFLSAVTQLRCTSGHRAVTLVKTVALSFPHCAVLSDEWQLALHYTHDHLGDAHTGAGAGWHSLTIDRKAGCAQINESGAVIYCHVDASRCYILTNRLGRYALVGEPAERNSVCGAATKLLRVAAFSTVLSAVAHEHSIRVYVLDDSFDALQHVLDSERVLGGCLLDSPKQLPFTSAGHNLRVNVDTLSLGWRTKSRLCNCQLEIPFSHVWTGSQTRLHCSFMFERCTNARLEDVANRFLCRLTAGQVDQPQAQAVINVAQECASHADLTRANTDCSESRTVSAYAVYAAAEPIFSDSVRHKLCALLDDDCASNWEQLADQFCVGKIIVQQLAALKDTYSPAETLLSVFEAKHVSSLNRDESLQELIGVLRRMKRPDCAVLLENELSNKF